MQTVYIYSLCEPDTGEVRYIGKAENLKERFKHHILDRQKSYRKNWIKGLRKRGLEPVMKVLKEVPATEWESWEKCFISNARMLGFRLVNQTDGGIGVIGQAFPPSRRAQIRRRYTGKGNPFFGKTHSSKAKQLMAEAKTGDKNPNFGKPKSAITRRRMRAAHLARNKRLREQQSVNS